MKKIKLRGSKTKQSDDIKHKRKEIFTVDTVEALHKTFFYTFKHRIFSLFTFFYTFNHHPTDTQG